MDKGNPKGKTEPQPTAPETPAEQEQAQKAETVVRIELEYDLASPNLVMRSRAPTLILSAVLRRAEYVKPKEVPQAAETKHVVAIEYDLRSNNCKVQSDAPDLITTGILVMAFSMLTQSQVLQRIQGMAAKARIVDPVGRPT